MTAAVEVITSPGLDAESRLVQAQPHGLAEPPISPRATALLTRPDLAALVDQVWALTASQAAALTEAFLTNFRRHRRAQIGICHRVSRVDPDFPHSSEVRAVVWEIAAAAHRGYHAVGWAAMDRVFVLLSGPLLTPQDRELFDAPWRTVLDLPPKETGPDE